MSKQIRLEIPLYHDQRYLPKVWLKIEGGKALAFADANCTISISSTEPKVSIDVSIPDELQKIDVFRPNSLNPVDYISMSWDWLDSQCNLRFPRLQKLSIIFDDRTREIPVVDGKPDRADWVYYASVSSEGTMLFLKKWALVVATLKDATVGTLYLSSTLIE